MELIIERGRLAEVFGDDFHLTTVYQPVVNLDTRQVLGDEALARGPHGSRFAKPDQLFAAAAELGANSELDWECQASVFREALAASLGASAPLVVDIEPCTLSTTRPAHLGIIFAEARDNLTVIFEITERALLNDPAAVITTLDASRAFGFGIALDEVVANPDSFALVPLRSPM